MRKQFLIALLLFIGYVANAQIRIPGTNVEFTLPANEWKYMQTTEVDRNTTVYLYAYVAHTVVDSYGDTTLPFLRVYVAKNYSKSVFDLVYARYLQQPYQPLDDYLNGLPSDGIGYIGAYKNPVDQINYKFRMIYFKDRTTAIEMRVETTLDTFDDFDLMFKNILDSTKIVKK